MKLKGVNPIEQHIEKIVLGVVFIILLAVIALQFVTTPNNIEDSGRSIAPAQTYTALEPQANQLQSQITDLNPALPDVKPVDLVDRYDNALGDTGTTRLALSAPLGNGVDIAGATGTDAGKFESGPSGPLTALAVPSTSTPVAAAQWATLDPYALLEVPEYADFIPSQQPYDFASISIEASFNGTELRDVLNGNSGGASIPSIYWSATGISILDFEVERQKLLADGSWGSAEPITKPPHTPTPINAVSSESGLQELVTVVGNAAQEASEVQRPMFPPTIAGAMWIPPSDRVEVEGSSDSDQIRRLQRQLARERESLARLTNAPRAGGNTGGGKTSGRDPGQSGGQDDRRQKRIDQAREKIEELEEELKELGVEDEGRPGPRVRTSRNDVRSVLEEESINLWAHDLSVEPGATYRYRTRIIVNNPLFRKQADLDPDDEAQQELAKDPFAYGVWSDWSAQVIAGAREYYFVTSATEPSPGGTEPTKTTVELYQMFYGHYRKSTLNVSPGDLLKSTLRVSGDLLAFDTESVPVEDAAAAVADLDSETPGDLPEGISALASRLSIEIGAYVLDVYQGDEVMSSGLSSEPIRLLNVLIRDSDGQIIVRTEQVDEASSAYLQASESASAANSSQLRAPGEQPAISPATALFEPTEP
jgi:hypothetical protein